MELYCKDCKYYLPVDVFQGLCKISKKQIRPEDAFCEKAKKIEKCKFCVNYTPEKEHIGRCGKSTLAYPDMIAAKCTDFIWISQK